MRPAILAIGTCKTVHNALYKCTKTLAFFYPAVNKNGLNKHWATQLHSISDGMKLTESLTHKSATLCILSEDFPHSIIGFKKIVCARTAPG